MSSTDPRIRRIKALQTYEKDREFAQFEESVEKTELFRTLLEVLDGIGFVKVQGKPGKKGDKGDDGRSITKAAIDKKGDLILTFNDGKSINAGRARGADGDVQHGNDGVGILDAEIRDGSLLLTLTDGSEINAGRIQQQVVMGDPQERSPFNIFRRRSIAPSSLFDLKELSRLSLPETGELVLVFTPEGVKLAPQNAHTSPARAFRRLSDTPASYHDQAGKMVRVNATEDGLEFADAPSPTQLVPSVETVTATTNGTGVDIDLTQLDHAWESVLGVFRNGVLQDKSKWENGITGDTLTLSGAVATNSFQLWYLHESQ